MMIDNARYTVLLKTLMENPETNKKLMAALSSYPLYEQKNKELIAYIPSREELNKAILNRYKYREIGFETIGRFLDELEISMNEIMPYYNGLYETLETMAEIEDPFGNVNMLETYSETRKDGTKASGKTSGTSTDSSTDSTSTETSASDTSKIDSSVNASSKNVESATPQSELSISSQNIDSVNYADKATWNKNVSDDSSETTGSSEGKTDTSSSSSSNSSSSTETETESETTGTVEHTFQRKGNHGVNTYAHDMIEFRESIINVTQKLINDKRLNELFMLVY